MIQKRWEQRTGESRAAIGQLERRIGDFDGKRDALFDALVHRNVISRSEYDVQVALLDEQVRDLRSQVIRLNLGNVDLTASLELGAALLTDLSGCWSRLERRHRSSFARAMYPTGLEYDGQKFGTAETPWHITVFRDIDAVEEQKVPPTGFEPVLPG